MAGRKEPWAHITTGNVIRLYGGAYNGTSIKVVIPTNNIVTVGGSRYEVIKNTSMGGYDGKALT